MLKKILMGLVGLVVVALAASFLMPGTTSVERAVVIDAPRSDIHAVLNGYSEFNAWSPWARRDPGATYLYEGPDSGVGAKMTWAGNDQVGAGTQEIVASADNRIDVRLEFEGQGGGDAYFLIERGDEGTSVTWGFTTDHGLNPISRAMGPMIKKYVGLDYEEGLGNLKSYVEGKVSEEMAMAEEAAAMAAEDESIFEVREEEVNSQAMLIVPISGGPEEISGKLGEAYGEIVAFMEANDLSFAGAPLSVQKGMDEVSFFMDAGIPVVDVPDGLEATGNIQITDSYAGKVLVTTHVGPYHDLGATYDKFNIYLDQNEVEVTGSPWESYIDDPTEVLEEELRTLIYYPVE